MPDDNQNQDTVTSPEDAKTPEIAIPTNTDTPVQSTVSTGADLPSDAPEGSRGVVDTALVKDDKSST